MQESVVCRGQCPVANLVLKCLQPHVVRPLAFNEFRHAVEPLWPRPSRSRAFCRGSAAYSCTAALPASGGSLERASGTCSLWTAALELSLWNLPPRPAPLFFSVPKATRQAPSRHLQTLPGTFGLGPKRTFGLLLHRSLCVRRESGEGASGTCSPCAAALELSLWNLPPRPAPLFFRVPKATSRRLQKLPGAFGLLLHRSIACVRRERGEGASGTCSPCTAALEPSLWNLPPRPAPLFFRIPKATRQATSSILASNASGSLGREPLGPTVP